MPNPVAIKKLNDVHVQMLDFIMANPGCTYAEIAAAMGGYSIGWISQIYNSDAFQAALRERQIETWGETKLTIKERVTTVGHLTLKRLEERIPVETDVDTLVNAADMVLKTLGYGPKGGNAGEGPRVGNQQNNFYIGTASKEDLARARELMHRPPQLPEKTVSSEDPTPVDQK